MGIFLVVAELFHVDGQTECGLILLPGIRIVIHITLNCVRCGRYTTACSVKSVLAIWAQKHYNLIQLSFNWISSVPFILCSCYCWLHRLASKCVCYRLVEVECSRAEQQCTSSWMFCEIGTYSLWCQYTSDTSYYTPEACFYLCYLLWSSLNL